MRKPHRSNEWSLGAALCLLSAATASAQDAAPPSDPAPEPKLEVFKGPSQKEIETPRYPFKEVEGGREGWVALNFMVDTKGKPYEPVVVASSGNKAFEEAAIKALEASTFNPASLNGRPVDAGHNFKYRFVLRGDSGARPAFVRDYREFNKALRADDKERARQQLDQLLVSNLYEEAYMNLATYAYHAKWGDKAQQLGALRAAIAEEADAQYLPRQTFVAALESLLQLELDSQDFASFLLTWEKFERTRPDKAVLEKWRPVVADVEKLRSDERSYRISATIEPGTSWFYRLHKRRFVITPRAGAVSEIKLRCDAEYVFFKFDPQIQYSTSDKYGVCTLEVVGDQGAKFDLIQL